MCSILEGLESNWVLVSSDPLEKSICDFLSSSNIPNDTKTEQIWLSVVYIILTFINKCCQCLFLFQFTATDNFAKCGNFTEFLSSNGRCCHLECQNTTDDDVPGGVKLPSGRTERGCRDHEPASVHWLQTWDRPGGVQITGTPVTGSRTGIICTVKTPGRCQGTQVMLCKWNMTSDTNSHVGCHYQLQNQGSSQDATAECWLSAERLSETPHIWGSGFDPNCCSITQSVTRSLAEKNIMNGYLLLMQFEKLDMSSFISQS